MSSFIKGAPICIMKVIFSGQKSSLALSVLILKSIVSSSASNSMSVQFPSPGLPVSVQVMRLEGRLGSSINVQIFTFQEVNSSRKLFSNVLGSSLIWTGQILKICCCFLQASGVEKIKTNIRNLTRPNQ